MCDIDIIITLCTLKKYVFYIFRIFIDVVSDCFLLKYSCVSPCCRNVTITTGSLISFNVSHRYSKCNNHIIRF